MLKEIIIAIISGLVGGGGVGGLLMLNLQRLYNQLDHLKKEVATLEQDRINKIDRRVELHCDGDQSQRILNELDHLAGTLNKLSDKVDRLVDETAEQRAQIKDLRQFVNNTYNSLRTLRERI